ncbi:outer membrane beta-barrel protein [Aureitalea sp. L0-47]|uniref:outer membrane beta-barrel protein n=1 Tax=Aureitalea sp. L0-47 TaxID=2816962 RepID=UPI002238753C|nr:outer membrane beta-barrel protein [Aureitalea sp. L0-47]MCW5520762.1 outer membrane beta-barrel protein [Aureitalea sp. L0-47]
MKKLLLIVAVVCLGISANAQNQFRAGISGGLPIGDAGDLATFAIAVDLGYLFEISENFDVGVTTGYSHSFGDTFTETFGPLTVEVDVEDVQFIPIAASGRFEVAPSFTLGADVGYALGVNDGNDGGFYYSPRAQYSVSEAIDIVAAFRGVSVDGGSWDIISAGVEFGID